MYEKITFIRDDGYIVSDTCIMGLVQKNRHLFHERDLAILGTTNDCIASLRLEAVRAGKRKTWEGWRLYSANEFRANEIFRTYSYGWNKQLTSMAEPDDWAGIRSAVKNGANNKSIGTPFEVSLLIKKRNAFKGVERYVNHYAQLIGHATAAIGLQTNLPAQVSDFFRECISHTQTVIPDHHSRLKAVRGIYCVYPDLEIRAAIAIHPGASEDLHECVMIDFVVRELPEPSQKDRQRNNVFQTSLNLLVRKFSNREKEQ